MLVGDSLLVLVIALVSVMDGLVVVFVVVLVLLPLVPLLYAVVVSAASYNVDSLIFFVFVFDFFFSMFLPLIFVIVFKFYVDIFEGDQGSVDQVCVVVECCQLEIEMVVNIISFFFIGEVSYLFCESWC